MKNIKINKNLLEAYKHYYYTQSEKTLSDSEVISHLKCTYNINENPKKPSLKKFLEEGCCLSNCGETMDFDTSTGLCSGCQFADDYGLYE